MNVEKVKQAIELLKEYQKPKVDYADLVCAGIEHCGKKFVYEDPLDYAIDTSLKVLDKELERLENKPLTIEELKSLIDKNGSFPVWYEYADTGVEPEIVTKITYDSDRECYFICFKDDSFIIFSKHTKIYKYKTKGQLNEE